MGTHLFEGVGCRGWVTISSPLNITASGSTFTPTIPAMTNVRGQHEWYGNNVRRRYKLEGYIQDSATEILKTHITGWSSVVANNTINATIPAGNAYSINTSSLFSSKNPTTKTVPLYLGTYGPIVSYYVDGNWYDELVEGAWTRILTINVTLNAPPSFTSSKVSFDTSYVYAGLTTASVDISSLSAQYGGSISEVKLTIGNQTATRTNNGTLSILLNTAGTFTPTVSVKDSRGQVTTKTLDAITVNGYTAPNVTVEVQRSLANGTPADEGAYGTITSKFNFTKAVTNLAQPTVTIDGTTASVTWYSTRASDGKLSGSVNWASLSSPATVYGVVSASNIQKSYQITVTPKDTISSGTPITQTLGSAFYTIDFLAGGHGIAFGQPSSEDGFFCNMDAHFKDKANAMRALFDFVYPVGSYYETSNTSFNPNNTWGGTWVLETAGQVHVSAGTGYSVSGALNNTSDGGASTVTLSTSQIPAHTHGNKSLTGYFTIRKHRAGYAEVVSRSGIVSSIGSSGSGTSNGTSGGSSQKLDQVNFDASHTHDSVGGGGAHNNMQPYIVVNRWHRTA